MSQTLRCPRGRAEGRRYSARYKLRILGEYEQLDKAGKGALLRREGLYTSLISEWRKQRDRGALEALGRPRGPTPAAPAAAQVGQWLPEDVAGSRPTMNRRARA